MKRILLAVNAKYIHSNLAVYSLKAYAEKYGYSVCMREFTINQREDEILRELYREAPDVLAVSVYIWNVTLVRELLWDISRILPGTELWPVSYTHLGRNFPGPGGIPLKIDCRTPDSMV